MLSFAGRMNDNIDVIKWLARQNMTLGSTEMSMFDKTIEDSIRDDNLDIFKDVMSIPGLRQTFIDRFYDGSESNMIETFLKLIPEDNYEYSQIRAYLESGPLTKSSLKG